MKRTKQRAQPQPSTPVQDTKLEHARGGLISGGAPLGSVVRNNPMFTPND